MTWDESGLSAMIRGALRSYMMGCFQWLSEIAYDENFIAAIASTWSLQTTWNETVFNNGIPC